MKWHYLGTIVRNNLKLILRNRLYQWFFLFIMALVVYFHIRYQSNLSDISNDGIFTLASFIPFMNIYFYSIFYVIPLLFLAVGAMGKERKVDSMEVIFYRPESNAEYVWGVCLAYVVAFVMMGVVSLGAGMFVHLFLSDAPFHGFIYLFYLLTLVVPTTVFVLGGAMFMQSVMKNRLLSLTILLLYFGVTFFYIEDRQYGVFDFAGLSLENTWSEMTGHPDLPGYLLQRACWLFLGIGLVQLSVVNFGRLANKVERRGVRVGRSLLLLFLGIACGFTFWVIHEDVVSLRRQYAGVYDKYSALPKGEMISQDIRYRQEGKRMVADSRLVVSNTTGEDLEEIILYLNPTLNVQSITVEGKSSSFERECQVVRLHERLGAGDSARVHVVYEGVVDGQVCYLNVPEEEVADTRKYRYLMCRLGKRYVFQERDFTLLIPEALWYPVTEPPVNPSAPFVLNRNLTRYKLQVEVPEGMNAVSQGRREVVADGQVVFHGDYPLFGISLCMGYYDTYTAMVDSVYCELNVFKRGRPLLSDIEKPEPGKLSAWKKTIEEKKMEGIYAYNRFVVTEVPVAFASYYRGAKQRGEYVQPELVFFPERGAGRFGCSNPSLLVNCMNNLEGLLCASDIHDLSFVWKGLFGLHQWNMADLFSDNMQRDPNPYLGNSLFLNEEIVFRAGDYPVIVSFFHLMLREKKHRVTSSFKKARLDAINYMASHSLYDALQDRDLSAVVMHEVFLLKLDEMLDYFKSKGVSNELLYEFISNYLVENRFKYVDFNHFDEDFMERFGVGWTDWLCSWYNDKGIPRFLVKDFTVEKVESRGEEDKICTMVRFEVFNDSDKDGMVQLYASVFSSPELKNLGYILGVKEKPVDVVYEVKAREGRKVSLFVEDSPRTLHLRMWYSANIPNEMEVSYDIDHVVQRGADVVEVVGRENFQLSPDEIVVDNEDEGFRVVAPASRLRDYFKKKTGVKKYENLMAYVFVNDEWKCLIDKNAYGAVIKSALFRLVGNGESYLEWSTNLEKEGLYEVFVYIPEARYENVMLSSDGYDPPRNRVQTYQVVFGDEEHEVSVDTRMVNGWLSLGKFHGQGGVSKVTLFDTGEPFQVMIGDAVKWVYKGSE